jgi:cation diffusion facilitator family transporter
MPQMSTAKKAIKATWLSIIGNALLAVIKGVAGIFGNSYALIADAIESTADIFSSIMVLLGIHYSTRPPDRNHPYGHGRAEPLITFVVVGFLVASALIIGFESWHNIHQPHDLPHPFTLIVLAGIILTKEIFFRIVQRRGHETNSSSLKADAWHHRSDAITSFTAFIGISIALILGPGYESADDWAALVASGVILYNAYLIFRPALGEIMDEQLYEDLVQNIRSISLEVKGVINTEKCHVRKTGMTFHVDLHVIVKGTLTVWEGHVIAHELKDHLLKSLPQVADVLIHIEPDQH